MDKPTPPKAMTETESAPGWPAGTKGCLLVTDAQIEAFGEAMAAWGAAQGHVPRHPTLAECEAAGRGPDNYPGKPYEAGGLPNTEDERARFEAYMRGHCWDTGQYVEAEQCYDSTFVRCLFGVWRDRGALATVWPNLTNPAQQGDCP